MISSFAKLPPREQAEAHKGLRALLPRLSGSQWSDITIALAGSWPVEEDTWPAYARLLDDDSPIIRLEAFDILVNHRKYEGLEPVLVGSMLKETDAGVRDQMRRLLKRK